MRGTISIRESPPPKDNIPINELNLQKLVYLIPEGVSLSDIKVNIGSEYNAMGHHFVIIVLLLFTTSSTFQRTLTDINELRKYLIKSGQNLLPRKKHMMTGSNSRKLKSLNLN